MADRIPKPQSGTRIDYRDGKLIVPDDPIVPFIEGDGTGPDIWRATRYVLDGTVEKVYGGEPEFHWDEGFARGKANEEFGEDPPQETIDDLQHHRGSIKGAPVTPLGRRRRSPYV